MQGGISWTPPYTSHTLHPRLTRQSPHALSVVRWTTALRIVPCAQLHHQPKRHQQPHLGPETWAGVACPAPNASYQPGHFPPSASACHGTVENAPSREPATSSTFVPHVEASMQLTTALKPHLTQATDNSTPHNLRARPLRKASRGIPHFPH